MKLKVLILLCFFSFFLQGYEFKYEVPKLDATNNAVERNNKGIMYMEMGHYNAAMTEFKVAISLNPSSPASAAYYNNLGLLYTRIKKYTEAAECFEAAIKLNPVFLEYYENLVRLYDKSGTIDNYLTGYIRQIAEDEKNSHAQLMAGLICSQMEQNENAINYLKKYLTIEKNNLMKRAVKEKIRQIR